MNSCFVALKDPAADPLSPESFLRERGLPLDKARAFLKDNPGFLGRRLPPLEAKALLEAAGAAGLGAFMAEETALPDLPPPLKVARVVPRSDGFEAVAGAAFRFVPAGSVILSAVFAWDAPARPLNTSALAGSLLAKIRDTALGEKPPSTQATPPRETFFRAEVLAGNGALRLQLEPGNLDFSPLGGDMRASSLENLRLLLDKIATPAIGAARNAFLNAFLASRPLAGLKAAGPAACDRDLARLLLLVSK